MTSLTLAIDFGASNTDLVVRTNGTLRRRTVPSVGQPTELRIRELIAESGVAIGDVAWIAVTGGNRQLVPDVVDNAPVAQIDEVQAIGRGGLSLATVDRAIVTSAGSGTAVISAGPEGFRHVTGSGVGGGTLVGLGRMLLGETNPRTLDALSSQGSASGLNLTIGEILGGAIGSLPPETTAVNFGRVARQPMDATPADTAAALVNMVGQVIAVIAINAARATAHDNIVIVGHMTDLPTIRETLELVGKFYNAPLLIPEFGGYATAMGALLAATDQTTA